MRLLFDQNLSPRLVTALADVFPGSTHVQSLGLERADDAAVRAAAMNEGLTLVSKDGDLVEMVLLHGFPPKVVWLRIGNCTTSRIETLLRNNAEQIREFGSDPESGVLSLS